MSHIAIFDIGKTNKKCFVFDEAYQIVFEKSITLPETTDEDGDPCEDIALLSRWITESVQALFQDNRFQIRALNCTTYGASFVHLDAIGQPITPVYNYLKPFPEDLKAQFFAQYGGEAQMALQTASPVLGSLNSGLQLYRIKYRQPEVFARIKYSMHLPQFAASLLSPFSPDACCSEMTSLGCHTLLWDFDRQNYHPWVRIEGIDMKLPPIRAAQVTRRISLHPDGYCEIGIGLHDSSAALIPYLACFKESFLLISTGTWCIALNPFNETPLTAEDLAQDCLCYLSYEGKPVKAARFFGGHLYETGIREMAARFELSPEDFMAGKLAEHSSAAGAYAQFMNDFMEKQLVSVRLALGDTPVQRIFVDGGFSKNETYMRRLAAAFPDSAVYAAEVAQATALGAALAIHDSWNTGPVPARLISLKQYIPL